jgi:hypothetical protein
MILVLAVKMLKSSQFAGVSRDRKAAEWNASQKIRWI